MEREEAFGRILADALEQIAPTRKEQAEALGVTSQALSNLVTRHTPSSTNAFLLGVVAALMDERTSMTEVAWRRIWRRAPGLAAWPESYRISLEDLPEPPSPPLKVRRGARTFVEVYEDRDAARRRGLQLLARGIHSHENSGRKKGQREVIIGLRGDRS